MDVSHATSRHRNSIPESLRVTSTFVNQNADRAVASALREAMHNAAAYGASDMVVVEHRHGEQQQMISVFHDGESFADFDDMRTSLEYGKSGGEHGVQGSGMKFSAAALAPRNRFERAATYVSSYRVRDDEGQVCDGWTTFVGKASSEQEVDRLVIKPAPEFLGDVVAKLPASDIAKMRVAYSYPVTVPKLTGRGRVLNWQVMAWLRATTSPELQAKVKVRFGLKDAQDREGATYGNQIGSVGNNLTKMVTMQELEEEARIDSLSLEAKQVSVEISGLDPELVTVGLRIDLLGELKNSVNSTDLIRLFGREAGVGMRYQGNAPASTFYYLCSSRHDRHPKYRRANEEPAYSNELNNHSRVHEQLGLPRLGTLKDERAGGKRPAAELMRELGVPVGEGQRYTYSPRFVVHFTFKTESVELFGARDPFFWWPEGKEAIAAAGELAGEITDANQQAIKAFLHKNERWFPKPSTEGLSPIDFGFKTPAGATFLSFIDPHGREYGTLEPGGRYSGTFHLWESGQGVTKPVTRPLQVVDNNNGLTGVRLRRFEDNGSGVPEYDLEIRPMQLRGDAVSRELYQQLINEGEAVSPRPYPMLLVEGDSVNYRMKQRINVPGKEVEKRDTRPNVKDPKAEGESKDTPYEQMDSEQLWGRFDSKANRLILNLDHPDINVASQVPPNSALNNALNRVYQRAHEACARQHARLRAEIGGKEDSAEANREVSGVSFDVLINGVLDAAFTSREAEDLFRKARAG